MTQQRCSLHTAFLAALLLLSAAHPAWATDTVSVGNFSGATLSGDLPEHWDPLTFEDIEQHTRYSLVSDGNITVIEADSNGSSSGLTRKITIDPQEYPVISWRWKIANIYQKGDVSRKSGDDYPARIYITFAYDPEKVGFWDKVKFNSIKLLYGEYPPINAINYIWASKAPKGMTIPNPYTDRVKMIVVESGDDQALEWISEKRNILQDYRDAFGEDPPRISGVAIMTDSDNTGETAKAWYGDIVFSKDITPSTK